MIDTEKFTELFLTVSTQHNVNVFTFQSSNLVHTKEEVLLWEGMPPKFIFLLFKLIKDKKLRTSLFKMPPFTMFPADVYGEKMLDLSWRDTE